MEELEAGTSNRYKTATLYDLAGIYSFIGDKEKAYYWLDRFVSENGWKNHHGDLESFIKIDLQLDNIRNDERFKKIMQVVTIEKDKIRKDIRDFLIT